MNVNCEYLRNVLADLEKSVGENIFACAREDYRMAGFIEGMLVILGCLKPFEKFTYLEGGRQYIPWFADMRWRERYPHMIWRIAKEHLKRLDEQEKADSIVSI